MGGESHLEQRGGKAWFFERKIITDWRTFFGRGSIFSNIVSKSHFMEKKHNAIQLNIFPILKLNCS